MGAVDALGAWRALFGEATAARQAAEEQMAAALAQGAEQERVAKAELQRLRSAVLQANEAAAVAAARWAAEKAEMQQQHEQALAAERVKTEKAKAAAVAASEQGRTRTVRCCSPSRAHQSTHPSHDAAPSARPT